MSPEFISAHSKIKIILKRLKYLGDLLLSTVNNYISLITFLLDFLKEIGFNCKPDFFLTLILQGAG